MELKDLKPAEGSVTAASASVAATAPAMARLPAAV